SFGETPISQSQPLCETEEASAPERHSLCYTTSRRDERTRETVEARRQSCGLQTYRDPAFTQHHRIGTADRHPRAHQAQAWQTGEQEAEKGQRCLFQMGLCRTA